MQHDISIDEARANTWIYDVETELDLVRTLMKKASTSITTPAGEDDTIMQGISKMGDQLNTVWTQACNVYEKATNLLKDALKAITKAGSEVMADLDSTKARIN